VFLAVVMVGAAGGTCWAVFFRTVGSPVSLSQALRLYRRDSATSGSTPVPAFTHDVLAPGVYAYATDGGEGLNLVGMSRSFPATSDMVVTAHGSCATVRWVPLSQHTETTVVCAAADHSLAVSQMVTDEAIAGATTTTTIDCPSTTYLVPPIAMPTVQSTSTCHQVSPAEGVTATGLVLGQSPLMVGRQRIDTLHVRLSLVFTGTDSGTSPLDFWISTDRGLIVREEEAAHITQGSVHYTEQMDTRLTDLTPVGG
jgi:hypothetical protein